MKAKNESERFKKGFYLGRMIWIRDESAERAWARTQELLLFCNATLGEVWTLSPIQFLNLVTGGIDRISMSGFGVILIRGLEDLSDAQAKSFVRAIRLFRAFQFGVGVRLILTSQRDFSLELHQIHECMPVVLDEGSGESDPGDTDSRVHSLIEIASKVAETPIRRLTERAAHFLEESVNAGEGEDLVLLLVDGMKRSRGSVLRLRDILPNFGHYFGPEDEIESYCN